MIEIIKKGIVPTYIHKCTHCCCVFKYQYADTEYLSLGDRKVICPACKTERKVAFVEYSDNHKWLTEED
jgi:hypothetical protein